MFFQNYHLLTTEKINLCCGTIFFPKRLIIKIDGVQDNIVCTNSFGEERTHVGHVLAYVTHLTLVAATALTCFLFVF